MAATQSAIGDYRLVARIGGGAMGGVYRAVYQPTGAEVAIKLLPPDLAADPVACGYFRRGAASAAALRHPNILTAWHHGEYAGSPYLIMPLVRGGTLRDRIARGPLAPAEALGYLRQLAAALDYAHSQGVIHRDVKPANLLLDGRGHLYLADFGIARALESATRFTDTGEGVGTPDYMAPEQARGHADGRSDLYAAAIILYQMLTGRVPFGGASAIEALLRHLQDPLPVLPLREARLALPPAIEGVLLRALAKDPDARYQRGADLVAAVEAAFAPPRRVEQRPPVAAVVPPPVALPRPVAVPVAPQPVAWPQPPRQPARHGTALVGFSVALAVALLFGSAGGVGAWFVLPRFEPLAAAKTVASVDPTPTATVAPSPSPRPSPSASPSPSAPPATPTATPTPLPKTGPYTIPAGWRTYTGEALPFAIAYPPTWTVEEHLADRYVLFQSPDPNVWLEILTFGKEKQGTTIDGERDNFNNAFRDACERAGVAETFNNTVSGLIFAALLATCDLNGKLYAYYIGAALYDDVPWYYVTFSPYAPYADNANAYFDPMLDSLNIYASR